MTVYGTIDEFPGYRFGSDGTVWSRWVKGRWKKMVSEWRQMRTEALSHGYRQVSLTSAGGSRKPHKVHQLILRAFRGPLPPGMCTRHLNGDRKDNRLENLAYGTYEENARDTSRHGRTNRGSRNPAARLNEDLAVEIRRRVAAGEKQVTLVRELGVGAPAISNVVRGVTYSHVEGGVV